MILKGSQRGGALSLAAHLLNGHDNEHVEVHEVRHFVADDLRGALQEARAISTGTRCKQFMFSLALNPPPKVNAPTAMFDEALDRIENKLGLVGQPRVVVFHEKHGRRHAHCVWSRINPEMKAINLPFFKTKLMEIAKELYLEHGWRMPPGMIDRTQRNPLNFTREQWEQAKRQNDTPQAIKRTLMECWAISDNRKSFQNALDRHGYYLAKGDRRGFVLVDWRGEVYSLSRWGDVPSKSIKARLGTPSELPGVSQTKVELDNKLTAQVQAIAAGIRKRHEEQLKPQLVHRDEMTLRHRKERAELDNAQSARWRQESLERNARLRTGLLGFIDRFTGNRKRTLRENEADAFNATKRDQTQRDELVTRQLGERDGLQSRITQVQSEMQLDIVSFTERVFSQRPDRREAIAKEIAREMRQGPEDLGPILSM